MHNIMRFPSEKNKQKGNRDMREYAELAVKHQLGTGKDVRNRSPPAIHRKSWALCSGQWPHCISDAGCCCCTCTVKQASSCAASANDVTCFNCSGAGTHCTAGRLSGSRGCAQAARSRGARALRGTGTGEAERLCQSQTQTAGCRRVSRVSLGAAVSDEQPIEPRAGRLGPGAAAP